MVLLPAIVEFTVRSVSLPAATPWSQRHTVGHWPTGTHQSLPCRSSRQPRKPTAGLTLIKGTVTNNQMFFTILRMGCPVVRRAPQRSRHERVFAGTAAKPGAPENLGTNFDTEVYGLGL